MGKPKKKVPKVTPPAPYVPLKEDEIDYGKLEKAVSSGAAEIVYMIRTQMKVKMCCRVCGKECTSMAEMITHKRKDCRTKMDTSGSVALAQALEGIADGNEELKDQLTKILQQPPKSKNSRDMVAAVDRGIEKNASTILRKVPDSTKFHKGYQICPTPYAGDVYRKDRPVDEKNELTMIGMPSLKTIGSNEIGLRSKGRLELAREGDKTEFPLLDRITDHPSASHYADFVTFKCLHEDCAAEPEFADMEVLAYHVTAAHPLAHDMFQCLVCGNVKDDYKELKKHVEETHSDLLWRHKQQRMRISKFKKYQEEQDAMRFSSEDPKERRTRMKRSAVRKKAPSKFVIPDELRDKYHSGDEEDHRQRKMMDMFEYHATLPKPIPVVQAMNSGEQNVHTWNIEREIPEENYDENQKALEAAFSWLAKMEEDLKNAPAAPKDVEPTPTLKKEPTMRRIPPPRNFRRIPEKAEVSETDEVRKESPSSVGDMPELDGPPILEEELQANCSELAPSNTDSERSEEHDMEDLSGPPPLGEPLHIVVDEHEFPTSSETSPSGLFNCQLTPRASNKRTPQKRKKLKNFLRSPFDKKKTDPETDEIVIASIMKKMLFKIEKKEVRDEYRKIFTKPSPKSCISPEKEKPRPKRNRHSNTRLDYDDLVVATHAKVSPENSRSTPLRTPKAKFLQKSPNPAVNNQHLARNTPQGFVGTKTAHTPEPSKRTMRLGTRSNRATPAVDAGAPDLKPELPKIQAKKATLPARGLRKSVPEIKQEVDTEEVMLVPSDARKIKREPVDDESTTRDDIDVLTHDANAASKDDVAVVQDASHNLKPSPKKTGRPPGRPKKAAVVYAVSEDGAESNDSSTNSTPLPRSSRARKRPGWMSNFKVDGDSDHESPSTSQGPVVMKKQKKSATPLSQVKKVREIIPPKDSPKEHSPELNMVVPDIGASVTVENGEDYHRESPAPVQSQSESKKDEPTEVVTIDDDCDSNYSRGTWANRKGFVMVEFNESPVPRQRKQLLQGIKDDNEVKLLGLKQKTPGAGPSTWVKKEIPETKDKSRVAVCLTPYQRTQLFSHMDPADPSQPAGPGRCRHCNFEFPRARVGRRHIIGHIRAVRVRCTLCKAGSFFISEMRNHILFRHCQMSHLLPPDFITEESSPADMLIVDDYIEFVHPSKNGHVCFTTGKIISMSSMKPYYPDPQIEASIAGTMIPQHPLDLSKAKEMDFALALNHGNVLAAARNNQPHLTLYEDMHIPEITMFADFDAAYMMEVKQEKPRRSRDDSTLPNPVHHPATGNNFNEI